MRNKNILTEEIKRIEADFKEYTLKKSETEEGLNRLLRHRNKPYTGTFKEQRVKFINWATKQKEKQFIDLTYEYNNIMNSEDFKGDLVVTVEWKKSHMWGLNPKASTNYGFEGSSIGGCGYDKLSTATAEALNSHKPLLKLMYERINKELQKPKKVYIEQNGIKGGVEHILPHVLGYGSGHGIKPYFSGGVGVSCHQDTIKGLGLEMKDITRTKTIDVFVIERA